MKLTQIGSYLLLLFLPSGWLFAQGTVPTFQRSVGQSAYTLLGRDPSQGGSTTIPTVLVPITLSFEAKHVEGKAFVMDASPDVPRLLHSPVFSEFEFGAGGNTQYADAMLRTTFPDANDWHTLLGKPEVKPVKITVPAGYGYVLTSKKSSKSVAVADLAFIEKELFKQIPLQPGKLIVAVTHDTTYFADSDATVCCSWGTHGVDNTSGNSFLLSTYLHDVPAVVQDGDVQAVTQQLAEFVNDPLHDPLDWVHKAGSGKGNSFPRWMRPESMRAGDQGSCGGEGGATSYFYLEPTETNRKNNFPVAKAFQAESGGTTYHLENVALLPWFTGQGGSVGKIFSFPDPKALAEPAKACPPHRGQGEDEEARSQQPMAAAAVSSETLHGHELIGYWSGGAHGAFGMRDIAPQWDVIIVAFATPDAQAPEGTLRFSTPSGFDTDKFKEDITYLKGQGKKVLLSLGGGGQFWKLEDAKSIPNFVSSVAKAVADYGFDGIDIDFENPSLALLEGDSDFRHPTTPSVVHLITGMRQLREHFGSKFVISLVPEGSQVPAGYAVYGGQFGTYLALSYGIRDILSFMDVQDYNTPPLEGLDGEIYQAGTVDYHAAMTELVLQGFPVGGDRTHVFPPLPANKVAVGFLTGDATPDEVSTAMKYLITGKAPAGTSYKLRRPGGYPGLLGAMFWTIDDDRSENYKFSNVVGPELHGFPAAH